MCSVFHCYTTRPNWPLWTECKMLLIYFTSFQDPLTISALELCLVGNTGSRFTGSGCFWHEEMTCPSWVQRRVAPGAQVTLLLTIMWLLSLMELLLQLPLPESVVNPTETNRASVASGWKPAALGWLSCWTVMIFGSKGQKNSDIISSLNVPGTD